MIFYCNYRRINFTQFHLFCVCFFLSFLLLYFVPPLRNGNFTVEQEITKNVIKNNLF